jgi:hypothetical protein
MRGVVARQSEGAAGVVGASFAWSGQRLAGTGLAEQAFVVVADGRPGDVVARLSGKVGDLEGLAGGDRLRADVAILADAAALFAGRPRLDQVTANTGAAVVGDVAPESWAAGADADQRGGADQATILAGRRFGGDLQGCAAEAGRGGAEHARGGARPGTLEVEGAARAQGFAGATAPAAVTGARRHLAPAIVRTFQDVAAAGAVGSGAGEQA